MKNFNFTFEIAKLLSSNSSNNICLDFKAEIFLAEDLSSAFNKILLDALKHRIEFLLMNSDSSSIVEGTLLKQKLDQLCEIHNDN